MIHIDPPAPDQQCRYDLQVITEVHQEIHGKFYFEDAHIKRESPLDPAIVLGVVIAVDHRDAEPAQHLDARPGAAVHHGLQRRHKNQLWDEERDSGERHPRVDVYQIRQY
jgi:hypothetical protein